MSNNVRPARQVDAAPTPALSDFVLVKRSDLEKLSDAMSDLWSSASQEGCEAPYFVADMNPLQDVRQVVGMLQQAQSLDRSLRRVDGDVEQGNGPILVVMPAGITDEAAVQVMNDAIHAANARTNNGADGIYFEALQEQLAPAGIAIQEGVELLRSTPWDADTFSGTELSSDECFTVVLRSSQDGPYVIDPVAFLAFGEEVDESVVVEPINGESFSWWRPTVCLCTYFKVVYPRSDRYGVPDMATRSGAIKYLSETFTMEIDPNLEVVAVDSGDESLLRFEMHALVPKDCVRLAQRNTGDRPSTDRVSERFTG